MTPKHLYIVLIAIVAIGNVTAQIQDELEIPVEHDNQFPPEKSSDTIDGSGDGVIDEPGEIEKTTTETILPPIEHTQTNILSDNIAATASEGDVLCPSPCVCHIEEDDFVVDCSKRGLTELPTPINENASILKLQDNKLTEIPKEISSLKKLKILNANDNSIMTLVSGSVSELPELVSLKLRNNRLIEYPQDLKNSFGLTKLKELDLGGNDMRTELVSDIFAKFEALRTITLPSVQSDSAKTDLSQDICKALPKLENVCIESCENESFDCPNIEEEIEGDLPALAGVLSVNPDEDENADPVVDTPTEIAKNDENTEVNTLKDGIATEATSKATSQEFSFRSAVNQQPNDVSLQSSIVEAPTDTSTSETPVKVGATTSDTKTGGVDKSIIGLVVAGMVVIVAGITIKKNWSSIKKRFSSNSRTPNERNGTNANGAAPEEVPLQDKSPV